MSLNRIVLRLARNPGTEFANGDDHRGYALTAPLTGEGHIDAAAFARAREACVVRRFSPNEDPQDGHLVRRGERWFFDYEDLPDAEADRGDEPVYRLGEHRFTIGDYVTVADEDGRPLTYKVADVAPA